MSHPVTTGERVYQGIRDMITSGELCAGDRLIQRQLAAQFATSNIPVVEAIRRLERDGLVICHANWGAEVRTWTRDDIEAIVVIREAIETHACRLFAQRATESERMALKEMGARFDECVRIMDRQGCADTDVDLHMFIVSNAGSSILLQMAENTRAITSCINGEVDTPATASAPPGPNGLHAPLIDALVRGDADTAEAECRQHIQNFLHSLMNSLDMVCEERLS